MRIVVCLKQVPNTADVKIDPVKGTLIREGVPSIINPDDLHALEEVICLREEHGAEVVVISMGPPQAETALREALALGADRAILITDKMFAGSDTFATANVLGAAVNKLGMVDLVICGQQAIDGDTAQVGPQLAQRLNIPQATYAIKIWMENEQQLIALRRTDNGLEELEIQLPALVTATKELNSPRFPTIKGIVDLKHKQVEFWSGADLSLNSGEVGLAGSFTQVKKTFAPQAKGTTEILSGADHEIIATILDRLKQQNIFRGGSLL